MPEKISDNRSSRADSEIAWAHPWAVSDSEREKMVSGDPDERKESKDKKDEKI